VGAGYVYVMPLGGCTASFKELVVEKSIQVGGPARQWANPENREKRRLFTRVLPESEPLGHEAVVVLTNAEHTESLLFQVKELRRDLPLRQKENSALSVAYWRSISNAAEGREYVEELTEHPVFDDRI
jgi:hypothetical protein